VNVSPKRVGDESSGRCSARYIQVYTGNLDYVFAMLNVVVNKLRTNLLYERFDGTHMENVETRRRNVTS